LKTGASSSFSNHICKSKQLKLSSIDRFPTMRDFRGKILFLCGVEYIRVFF